MLQELAARTQAAPWAIASMLFFLVVWVVIMIRLYRMSNDVLAAQARLALDDGSNGQADGAKARRSTD
ncbi:MAG: hypothetical protein AB7I50_19710 [Vicinamibacterales bacterium]